MTDAEAATSSARQAHFTRALPKIELHAHLNGSIRRSTLHTLAARHDIDARSALILSKWPSTLSEAFSVFSIIHRCVSTLDDVETLALEVGQDMEVDGVVYAEIRSTPRCMGGEGGAGEGAEQAEEHGAEEGLKRYVEAVLRGFERYTLSAGGNATVLRLLLSIDRAKHTAEDAVNIVRLAAALRHRGVVGIDLSGDPTKGSFCPFVPALQKARSLGLKITLHAGEVSDTDVEFTRMLEFHPDRFGHCCFLSASNLALLKQSNIAIELCLTSNLLSNSIPSGLLSGHHFGLHYRRSARSGEEDQDQGTICCISTDDSGVFGSPLSNEYRLVMDNFGLDERETFELAKRTLGATFLLKPPPSQGTAATTDEVSRKDWHDWKRIQSRFNEFERSWDWK